MIQKKNFKKQKYMYLNVEWFYILTNFRNNIAILIYNYSRLLMIYRQNLRLRVNIIFQLENSILKSRRDILMKKNNFKKILLRMELSPKLKTLFGQ